MNSEVIQKKIDNLYYWDMPVTKLTCDHFADQVILIYKSDEGYVNYVFNNCYRIEFEHSTSYIKDKPMKELKFSQIPYFLQKVVISEVEIDGDKFYHCNINMPPLTAEIICKYIEADAV